MLIAVGGETLRACLRLDPCHSRLDPCHSLVEIGQNLNKMLHVRARVIRVWYKAKSGTEGETRLNSLLA